MIDREGESLSGNELSAMLAAFDYHGNDTLPSELLEATMNGECPRVEYNSVTARTLPQTVISSMTLDDEHVDAIESTDPQLGASLKALVLSLPREDARLAPYNIPTLHIQKTGERIYYHPVTGKRIDAEYLDYLKYLKANHTRKDEIVGQGGLLEQAEARQNRSRINAILNYIEGAQD
jgi:hypothetical protein